MAPTQKEVLSNLESQMEKMMTLSVQTNEKVEDFQKTITETNEQLVKTNDNLNQLWTTVNKALQLGKENQIKLMTLENQQNNMKNDIKKEIME